MSIKRKNPPKEAYADRYAIILDHLSQGTAGLVSMQNKWTGESEAMLAALGEGDKLYPVAKILAPEEQDDYHVVDAPEGMGECPGCEHCQEGSCQT